MKNFIQCGEEGLALTAPYAVSSGGGFLVGSIFAVAIDDAASGASVVGMTEGVFDITALSTDTFSTGDAVYWDNSNKRCTSTSSGNTKIGGAVAAKASGATTVRIRLNGTV